MRETEIENLEIELLLDAVFYRYGYDFRSYARASISRRARQFLIKSGCHSISEMIPKLLRDEAFFEGLAQAFSITVTEMFRDPHVYLSIRKNVVPLLKTYPFTKIWHVGCATVEEVYSLAIVFKEEGLYDRATIFATDFNDTALAKAKEGIYPLDLAKKYTKTYQQAGGKDSFSKYYQADYDSMAVNQSLKKNITFANYNLVTDEVFGEMHLIVCRNVLIYFDRALQNRALKLFSASLATGGFLCLGDKESLRFTGVVDDFATVDEKGRIFKKLPGRSEA
ncbi:MAG: protein-glutamate O-methyltransferase CheR [Deltaproteobacteria bacterium]|nr:protein-glutamate O-methyltransferase CheR [Deltaproteobacteria bacterium]